MKVRHSVLVSGEACARYGALLDRAVRELVRNQRDGTIIPEDLAELLFDIVDTGNSWRQTRQTVEQDNVSHVSPFDAGVGSVEINTTEAARQLNINRHAVSDLIRRKRLPATKGRSGAWLIRQTDVDDIKTERRTA